MPRAYSPQRHDTSEPEGKPNYANEIEYLECEETTTPAFGVTRSAGSIVMSPENPKIPVAGGLRSIIGNPTPIAVTGFVMSLTPLSCDLMGWRGAGHDGAAHIGAYIFFGGVLLLVGGLLECLIGNTFSSVVFMSFGCFYLTLAATLQPFYGAYAAYSPSPTDPAAGLETEGFNASFETALAQKFQVGGGAVLLAACLGGWYLLFSLLLVAVDFPLQLPIGDLSHIVPGFSQLKNESDLERS
ncbi:hypothetical protein V500_06652 [Pseudogymnoascus sp. VKM F-4518 (FW-2643)]|nr:hypothetical protein V500_06652 [Pseudogymnoascus sp. VKM F-4518 (FW-2643)]